MLRELKFRVWNGMEMVYDVTVGKFGSFYVNPMSKGNGLDENDSASLTPFNTRYHNDTTVMQLTGIKDGKGNEVYEGDIIGRTSFFDKVVIWHKNGFYMYSVNNPEQLHPLQLDEFDIVVSHIYKNPEVVFNRAVGG